MSGGGDAPHDHANSSARRAARGVAAVACAATVLLGACDAQRPRVGELQTELRRLAFNTVSGGGVNVKLMPDPNTGDATVKLEEVFSFDRNHAICRVDTNPQAFRMQTHGMGDVLVAPHSFFMSMVATSIERFEVTTLSDGRRRVVMHGEVSCSTEVGQASVTLGGRSAAEPATYRIEAFDGGPGGGNAGDSFAFTVLFDPRKAPVNHALFGPEFTFTGLMVAGEVTIVEPVRALYWSPATRRRSARPAAAPRRGL